MIKKVKKETLTMAHYTLFCEVDPSKKMAVDHITRGIHSDYQTEELQGVSVLLSTHPRTLEIVNIAISEESRGRGIGQELLHSATDFTKKERHDSLEIRTGSTGSQQLYLYRKVGLRMTYIEPNFFIHHYDESIIESGLSLKDIVRLRLHLSQKEVRTEPFGFEE